MYQRPLIVGLVVIIINLLLLSAFLPHVETIPTFYENSIINILF